MEQIISACGLLCSECDAFLASQKQDAQEIERIARRWSEQYGSTIPAQAVWCDGCMTGGERACGHVQECEIRSCVVERGLLTCAGCADYACEKLQSFLAQVPPEAGVRERLNSLRGRPA